MVSFEDAQTAAKQYGERTASTWFENAQSLERPTYWFFPVGFVGSIGVVVDKSTGSVSPLGSGHTLELQLWAYEHDVLDATQLRVTRVIDLDRTVEWFLDADDEGPSRRPNPNKRRTWLRKQLSKLPTVWPVQRYPLPALKEATEREWFEYEVISRHPGAV